MTDSSSNDNTWSLLGQLVRYSIGTTPHFGELTDMQWHRVLTLALRHAVAGICSIGIERMDDRLKPPHDVRLRWAMAAMQTKARSLRLNLRTLAICSMLESKGLPCCVLKGQGAALYYPTPLLRQCGDIDVWVAASRSRVVAFARQYGPLAHSRYHHVCCHAFADVAVELHCRPSWLPHPLSNKRLQHWFALGRAEQMAHRKPLASHGGLAPVPTTPFCVVYMLVHIYNHFFDEGIGIRQLLDYHYVIEAFADGATKEQRDAALRTIERLGLATFAASLMHVMSSVLGTRQQALLFSPNVNKGRQMMAEVAATGNLGQANALIERSHGKTMAFYLSKLRYKAHLARIFPAHAAWHVAFWIYQLLWRAVHR